MHSTDTKEICNIRLASLNSKVMKVITPPGPLTSFPSLPTELHLKLFSHFPLKALVVSRAVSRQWRNIFPAAGIPPARRVSWAAWEKALGITPPQLYSVAFVPHKRWIPALCLWVRSTNHRVWLILDEDSNLHGKFIEGFSPGSLYGDEKGDNEYTQEDRRNFVLWLQAKWGDVVDTLLRLETDSIGFSPFTSLGLMDASGDMFGNPLKGTDPTLARHLRVC
ncbi:hypothetical protein M422DRAFT_255988 [Sphaerobolus stellatus SS14]|uniref:F-box domain-containing protein n=1 Tax=Sphaerobolus stellatus (strain SS14) TaxID=990650 RepID=A0A0C9VST6_SPHS4|nr:hypothetical protein M422DRAFT_255986 [Sphaerobolus stellatus SS14]KIJ41136.1 hypothetical protein M422DRAFT_255988 [Sphaerobolus stellatus SS14]